MFQSEFTRGVRVKEIHSFRVIRGARLGKEARCHCWDEQRITEGSWILGK